MESHGESQNGPVRTLQPLDTNGQQQPGHPANGNITSSSGDTASQTNGSHHSECGSPDTIHSPHQMPPTPITPNTHELDLSRVKVEPEAMNVIVKQEGISAGQGGKKASIFFQKQQELKHFLLIFSRNLQFRRQRGLEADFQRFAKHHAQLPVRVFHEWKQQQLRPLHLAEHADEQRKWVRGCRCQP